MLDDLPWVSYVRDEETGQVRPARPDEMPKSQREWRAKIEAHAAKRGKVAVRDWLKPRSPE